MTDDEVNAIVDKAHPVAPGATPLHFGSVGPVGHEPDRPAANDPTPAPCNQVLPAYFGGGDPPFTGYVSSSKGGIYNVWFKELIVQYASTAQASQKFAQLTETLPACAQAAAHQPAASMALTIEATTADSVRFHTELVGEVRERTNAHVINDEYRLVGTTIVGVSSTEPPEVVTLAADQLRDRISG